MSQQDSFGNTDPQRGARDADAMHSGDKSNEKALGGGLSSALSNDENGFSNSEGFNTDRGHENLAESGLQTSDMNRLENQRDMDDQFENDDSRSRRADSENNNLRQDD